MRKALLLVNLGIFLFVLNGCIGYGLPHIFQKKPYTLLRGGDQLGRDILANRILVATKVAPINDMSSNEILSLLGEPQYRKIHEKNISEDWHYVYYKRYKMWPQTDKGFFLVRFYHDQVIDVIKT